MRRTAALIVGGGPAGSAAAIMLARGGARPLLLDRATGAHDVVCGGFLGWDALAALRRVGLDAGTMGAPPIAKLRLVSGTRTAESDLPFAAAGLSRRRLDAALLSRARDAGAGIERGVAVRRVEGQAAFLEDGGQMEGEALFLASGKHDVRGLARPRGGTPAAGLRVAIVPGTALRAALAGVIELHLFAQGYAGLLLQEDGSANLCLSVTPARLKAAGGTPERFVAALGAEAPLLGERLAAATEIGAWSAVAGVPYGWRAGRVPPGLFRLGDQAAVISSLAGDGVAIALESGRAAAEACLAGGPAASPTYQAAFARHVHRPLKMADMLRHAAERPLLAGPLLGLLSACPGLSRSFARLTRINS